MLLFLTLAGALALARYRRTLDWRRRTPMAAWRRVVRPQASCTAGRRC